MDRTFVDQVYERDIDLLILEELHCDGEFQRLIASRLFGACDASFESAWNSVSDVSYGESDLIATFAIEDETTAVLLENKIKAPFQQDQALRYYKRGELGLSAGLWNRFITCLLAPSRYIEATDQSQFDHCITYESLTPHFRRNADDAHGQWRAALLEQAAAGGASGSYVMKPDANTSGLFLAVWKLANDEFPQLRMRRQEKRPRKSVWTQFPDADLPKPVYLVHKASDGASCDLTFPQTTPEELDRRYGSILESDMFVCKAGKSAAIRILTPQLDQDIPFEQQVDAARAGLSAAARLLELCKRHGMTYR